MAKTYQDTFTRTAAALAGSTSSDGLFTWTVPDGVDPNTNGTAINQTANQFTGMTSADCDTDNIYAEIDFSFVGGGTPVFWIDVSSNGTYPGAGSHGYEAACFGGNAKLFAVNSGAFTQIGTVAHTIANGTYRLERNGSAITLKKDGATVLSVTDSSEPTGAGNRRAAMGGDAAGAPSGQAWAEFRYGDIVSSVTVAQEAGIFSHALSGCVIGRVDA